MGKKGGEVKPKPSEQKEGHNLLGAPTFQLLENGRFKCVETGHELPPHARDAYADSKHCRLGLIDSALARSKPPLNMFTQHPDSRSKLLCKLTGLKINKSEEHIWKHINGRRFLNMLEKKESEKEMSNGTSGKQDEEKSKKKKKSDVTSLVKQKKKIKEDKEKVDSEVKDSVGKSFESEDDADFWMPPAGERWDNDDGGDRWGSDSESGFGGDDSVDEDAGVEAVELSKQTKQTSLEIGASSFGSRKKKAKTNDA